MTRKTLLLALLAVVLTAGAALAATDAVVHFEPDPEAAANGVLEGTTWVGDGGTWTVWIKQLDAEERLNFIERVTGFAIDPFAGRPDAAPAYHTFLLVLENRGAGALNFNPQSCWLETNRNKVLLPRGLADISFNYRVTGRELPVAYEKVQDALLERALSLGAGERAAGLLVYDRVAAKTKRWTLGVRFTLPDGERAAFAAPYRRTDLAKKKGKKR